MTGKSLISIDLNHNHSFGKNEQKVPLDGQRVGGLDRPYSTFTLVFNIDLAEKGNSSS